MIVAAAIAICFESIQKWIAGLQLEHLGTGVLLVAWWADWTAMQPLSTKIAAFA